MSYIGMFRMKFIAGMQYRAAAWAGVATQFFWGFMFLMIYRAFYRSSSITPPMEWSELVSYRWLEQAFFALIMLWSLDGDLLDSIKDGNAAYELCRPYDLYGFWYFRLLASRLSSALLRCVPILLIAFFLPAEWRLQIPPTAGAAFLFLLSLSLALLLVVAVSMFIYILTFITLTPTGGRILIGVSAEFLMGNIIPIPFMPEKMQNFMNYLPFRYMSDLPFRIYSGNIVFDSALQQIGIQILWIAGLIILGKWAFSRVMRRVVVQGG
jgi:ABC-2 type transport system permease protein